MGFTPSTTDKQACKHPPPGLTWAMLDLGCFITGRESGIDSSGLLYWRVTDTVWEKQRWRLKRQMGEQACI